MPIFYFYDGAEVYTGSEFLFWTWTSLARGASLDVDFPILGIPAGHVVGEPKVKQGVFQQVTDFIAWSTRIMSSGTFPQVGCMRIAAPDRDISIITSAAAAQRETDPLAIGE